jgi:hypothetical protein
MYKDTTELGSPECFEAQDLGGQRIGAISEKP